MKRVLTWIGYVVGGLLVLIVLAVGTVYAISSSRMSKTYSPKVAALAIPTDSASVARGQHLVEAVGKCQGCHGDRLAGGIMFEGAMFANLTTANLTPGKDGIGSSYKDQDWVRAIRHGVGRDGKTLLFMPTKGYTHFNDTDLAQMIAYLKTLPPADTALTRRRSIGPIARTLSLVAGFPLYSASYAPENMARPVIPEGPTAEYGKYLIDVGVCRECHGDNLGGQTGGPGPTPNLTRGGELGKWNEADFVKVIRTGARPDGRTLSTFMPWQLMKGLSDAELAAMWNYLQTVPPVTPSR
jgi:cytochrome c553